MKRTLVCLTLLGLLVGAWPAAALAVAGVSGAPPVKCGLPMLITNAGQGPGGKMARLLVTQSKAVATSDFDYKAEPLEADLRARPYKTLLVVIGSTAKGLGASGITIDDEINRLNKMMAEAKRLKLQVVALLLEGEIRRGKPGSADERSIDAIAPYAQWLIVKKDGNEDGKFTALAAKTKAPLTFIDESLDFTGLVKLMFAK